MGNKMYTTDDVAERYRVARCTVWRWIREGKLTGVKYGRAFLFTDEDLRQFEEVCTHGKSVPYTG